MPIELTKISSSQLERLPRSQTVFFFPVGPIEDHGPHLPMGMDLMEAERLAWLTAQKLENDKPGWVGVLLPPVPLGVEANTTGITLTVRPYILRDWLVDSCRALIRIGFVHFVCFSGHLGPRQLTAIEDAGKTIRRFSIWKQILLRLRSGRPVPTLISANSGLISVKDVLRSPLWPDPEEHGGKRDTSIALAIAENCVDPLYKNLVNKDLESSSIKRVWSRITNQVQGYWGNPQEAESAFGLSILNEQVKKLFPKMRAIWEGAPPASSFRSWYSIIPPNNSFYRIWLLLIAIFIFLSGWLYLCLMLLPLTGK
ncbi:MAG: creatininase family protein [Bdellovibrionia bacterium]